MDIQFFEPDETPLPPDEIHIREVSAQPYPDGRRVKIGIKISPFQVRPNIDLRIVAPDGEQLATTSIIEATEIEMELIMHLRGTLEQGRYQVQFKLGYPDTPQIDLASIDFDHGERH